jgi:hypothetical protein
MKVIIAGSRSIRDYSLVVQAISDSGFEVSEVVSGRAAGVDTMGEQWANERNIPCTRFPAKWDVYGKRAGIKRNEEMAAYADAMIAIWDGVSRGTSHMILEAQRRCMPWFVLRV